MQGTRISAKTDCRPDVDTAPDRMRWWGLAVIVAAQFMVVLDVAIVNVALPSIKTDLNFSQESLQWVITAYTICFGGVLLLGGRLADLLGRRRLFMTGLLIFTVSSLFDGHAWSENSLIAFRSLQGLGAALLSPAALSILTSTFGEGRERNLALGIWSAASGSSGAAGVLLGGALTSSLSWSWIFYVNVPVGILVLTVSPFLLRESRAELEHRRFDCAGATSITSALMLLEYAMTRATQHGWGTDGTIGMLAASGRTDTRFPVRVLRPRGARPARRDPRRGDGRVEAGNHDSGGSRRSPGYGARPMRTVHHPSNTRVAVPKLMSPARRQLPAHGSRRDRNRSRTVAASDH